MKTQDEIINLLTIRNDNILSFAFLVTYKNGEKEKIYNDDIDFFADYNDVTKQYICPSTKSANIIPDNRNNAQGYFKFVDIESQNSFLSEYEIIDLN